MADEVAQQEYSNIKFYVSAFRYIYIYIYISYAIFYIFYNLDFHMHASIS